MSLHKKPSPIEYFIVLNLCVSTEYLHNVFLLIIKETDGLLTSFWLRYTQIGYQNML